MGTGVEATEESQDVDAENEESKDETRYIIPTSLEESILISEASEKPMAVLHMMINMKYKHVLCFTKSVEATHRLHLLVSSFPEVKSAEFSSNLTETQRKGIIRDFRNGSIDLLIASDAMARGMDIENVSAVVNYDSPANGKTYVHRVGRTARAGAPGKAITLLTTKEVFHFKQMFGKLHSGAKPKKMKVDFKSNKDVSEGEATPC